MITNDYIEWGNTISQNPKVSDICFGVIDGEIPSSAVAAYAICGTSNSLVFESKLSVLEFLDGVNKIFLETILEEHDRYVIKFDYVPE